MQSIIVYRNPAEAALWEGGFVFPLIVFIVSFLIIVVALMNMVDYLHPRWIRGQQMVSYVIIVMSMIIAAYIGHFFYLG